MQTPETVNVDLLSAAVFAVAVQNQDGSYTVYVNTRQPPAVRKAAIAELIGRIGEDPRQLLSAAVNAGT